MTTIWSNGPGGQRSGDLEFQVDVLVIDAGDLNPFADTLVNDLQPLSADENRARVVLHAMGRFGQRRPPLCRRSHLPLAGAQLLDQFGHHGPQARRRESNNDELVFRRGFLRVERAKVELPGHCVLGHDVARPLRGPAAKQVCIRERHLTKHLPSVRDHQLQVLTLLGNQAVEVIERGPDHDHDDDQHESGQVRERRAQRISPDVLENHERVARQPAEVQKPQEEFRGRQYDQERHQRQKRRQNDGKDRADKIKQLQPPPRSPSFCCSQLPRPQR
jgi:hypothetical protein